MQFLQRLILVLSLLVWTSPAYSGWAECRKLFFKSDEFSRKNRLSDFKFAGEMPGNFERSLNPEELHKFPRGSTIDTLTIDYATQYQRFLPQADGSFFDPAVHQSVIRNGSFEDLLMEASFMSSVPKEVHIARVFNRRGEVIHQSEVYFGSKKEIPGDAIENSMRNLNRRGGDIAYIELTHTHPSYDITLDAPDGLHSYFSLHPLSPPDRNVGSIVSEVEGVPVRIKAVSPNGYSYQQVWFKGRVIPDPKPHLGNEGLKNPVALRTAVKSPTAEITQAGTIRPWLKTLVEANPPTVDSLLYTVSDLSVSEFVFCIRNLENIKSNDLIRLISHLKPEVTPFERASLLVEIENRFMMEDNSHFWKEFETWTGPSEPSVWTPWLTSMRDNHSLTVQNLVFTVSHLSAADFIFCVHEISDIRSRELVPLIDAMAPELTSVEKRKILSEIENRFGSDTQEFAAAFKSKFGS
jgi:hypothetical protein